VKYVRLGLGFPFADEKCVAISERFLRGLKIIEEYAAEGFKALGTTFGPGSSRYDPQTKQTRWMSAFPDWAGTHNDARYYEILEHACEVLAQKTRGMVDIWQIANEPDIDIFRGELNDEQIDRFLVTSALAVKKASPESRTGINIGFITDDARRMIKSIYQMPKSPFDYLGIDGYFGSWQKGGPQDWNAYIDESHQLSGKPVIINEWGYSSLQSGPITDDPERKKTYNQGVCRAKAWNNVWKDAHSPEEQAEFMRDCIRIFADHPHCIGNFIFRWNDTATCWQCGQPECPAETAWGIVDVNNRPKPAYHALKEEIHRLFAAKEAVAK
jgi:arabinogalactan endo-1,4-beta-galactosidase